MQYRNFFVGEKAFVVRGIILYCTERFVSLWFTCERNQSRICNTNVGKSWLWWWQFVTKFVIALLSWCFTLLHVFMWVTEHSFGEANACYVNTVFGLCWAFIEQRCLRSDLFRTELFQFQLIWLSKGSLKVRVLWLKHRFKTKYINRNLLVSAIITVVACSHRDLVDLADHFTVRTRCTLKLWENMSCHSRKVYPLPKS